MTTKRNPLIGFFLATVLIALAPPAAGTSFEFEGIVEPANRAVLSSHSNGKVTEVLFSGGERVERDQPLIKLDDSDAKLKLAAAEAELAEAGARLAEADRQVQRQETLSARGAGARANLSRARTKLAAAAALVALRQAGLARAALDLERTVIRSPIDGYVSRPAVAVGAFLEAEAGPPLASIVALDPVIVAYRAPYADRLAALRTSRAGTVAELLSRIRVKLRLSETETLPTESTPFAASPVIDPTDGTVTVWAKFLNPDAILRPGMKVRVLSTIGPAKVSAQ
jgi:membrane fusion protein (multidrug efflux system)